MPDDFTRHGYHGDLIQANRTGVCALHSLRFRGNDGADTDSGTASGKAGWMCVTVRVAERWQNRPRAVRLYGSGVGLDWHGQHAADSAANYGVTVAGDWWTRTGLPDRLLVIGVARILRDRCMRPGATSYGGPSGPHGLLRSPIDP